MITKFLFLTLTCYHISRLPLQLTGHSRLRIIHEQMELTCKAVVKRMMATRGTWCTVRSETTPTTNLATVPETKFIVVSSVLWTSWWLDLRKVVMLIW